MNHPPRPAPASHDIYEGAPFPHCDQLVLHAPGKCEFCDHYPVLQNVRANNGIPFSGEGNSPDEYSSITGETRRPRKTIDLWVGNRAKPKQPHFEFCTGRVCDDCGYCPTCDRLIQAPPHMKVCSCFPNRVHHYFCDECIDNHRTELGLKNERT